MAVLGAGPPVDINNPHIQWLGRWAVEEHVRLVQDRIKFNKVVRTESDDESELGVLLHLFIDATNGDGKDAKYKAVADQIRGIYKPGLLEFKPAN
uniref:Cysteine proteinase inhibitor n=1 Tax=Aegilops tauschii TaxID=37682 RepID=M8AY29_AEGTA